jgi:hypothetical protein
MQELKRPDVRAFIGATGSGKGAGIREHLAALDLSRFACFDPMHEYGDLGTVVASAREALTLMQRGRFRVVWQPPDDTDYQGARFRAEFEAFCMGCFRVGDMVMLVEELELVTSPSRSPAPWRTCTKRGRHQGLRILAASQRPADCDKAFLSSCSYIRCFSLREQNDIDRMARALKVPYEQIDKLRTIVLDANRTQITYYEKDFNEGTAGEKTTVLDRRKRRAT